MVGGVGVVGGVSVVGGVGVVGGGCGRRRVWLEEWV